MIHRDNLSTKIAYIKLPTGNYAVFLFYQNQWLIFYEREEEKIYKLSELCA